MASRSPDLDAKDRVLACLVESVHAAPGQGGVATALLWLSLWPALDRAFRRQVRQQRPEEVDPGEIVSAIWDGFWLAVDRADLGRIHRVAATLTRNTERILQEAKARDADGRRRTGELPEDDCFESTEPPVTSDPSPWWFPPGLSREDEAERLRDFVVGIVCGDAELVIGAAVYDESHRELAERLGITHEVARKRYIRAIKRLRTHIEKSTRRLSQFALRDRVYLAEAGPETRRRRDT
jgi:RNA polymerase sigma-70 factor (ECF subfamily)